MKISKRVSELLSGQGFQYSNFQRGIIPSKNKWSYDTCSPHNCVKNAGRVMVLVLCISSDHALYLYKVS